MSKLIHWLLRIVFVRYGLLSYNFKPAPFLSNEFVRYRVRLSLYKFRDLTLIVNTLYTQKYKFARLLANYHLLMRIYTYFYTPSVQLNGHCRDIFFLCSTLTQNRRFNKDNNVHYTRKNHVRQRCNQTSFLVGSRRSHVNASRLENAFTKLKETNTTAIVIGSIWREKKINESDEQHV